MSDDVRGEVGTSRAIEMARSGASKADIAAKTGLPIEEAEALVTFHGKKRNHSVPYPYHILNSIFLQRIS